MGVLCLDDSLAVSTAPSEASLTASSYFFIERPRRLFDGCLDGSLADCPAVSLARLHRADGLGDCLVNYLDVPSPSTSLEASPTVSTFTSLSALLTALAFAPPIPRQQSSCRPRRGGSPPASAFSSLGDSLAGGLSSASSLASMTVALNASAIFARRLSRRQFC